MGKGGCGRKDAYRTRVIGENMTLQQLKYVIAVVESGSISEAAKRLYVAQPSLSGAVKKLEQELGFALFLRSSRGIALSADGAEFLGYARQVVEQTDLLERRYFAKTAPRRLVSISTQHYAFAVDAFVNLLKRTKAEEYEFTLRETRTHEIIDDVRFFRSEVGILYKNAFNERVIGRLLRESALAFHPLFRATPHIFVSRRNPLAVRESVAVAELADYPCLSFEQGDYNSFYLSEEILSTSHHKKSIRVRDRATLFNLLIGLDGYTISSGLLSKDLNGEDIVSVRLATQEDMLIGWIAPDRARLSALAQQYVEELKEVIRLYGAEVL